MNEKISEKNYENSLLSGQLSYMVLDLYISLFYFKLNFSEIKMELNKKTVRVPSIVITEDV